MISGTLAFNFYKAMNNNLFFTQNGSPNVYMMQPESWESVEQAISILKSGQVVLFNLEGIAPALAQRMTDFTSGCLCAIAGKQVAVGPDVFLFCPPNVTLSVHGKEQKVHGWGSSASQAVTA